MRFRLLDKLRLGVTAGGGFGMGVVGTASKLAIAAHLIALAGAVVAREHPVKLARIVDPQALAQ